MASVERRRLIVKHLSDIRLNRNEKSLPRGVDAFLMAAELRLLSHNLKAKLAKGEKRIHQVLVDHGDLIEEKLIKVGEGYENDKIQLFIAKKHRTIAPRETIKDTTTYVHLKKVPHGRA